ncbi:MAG: extracellular solute-binding protein [Leptolinea sp.]
MTVSNTFNADQTSCIRILCVDDPAVRLYEQNGELISTWSKANGTKVDIVILPWEKYPEKVYSVLQSGSSEFDVVMLPGYFWLPKFAANGWLTPLTNLAVENSAAWQAYDYEDILPRIRTELALDGQVYLLPSFSEVQVVYYRKDLLQKTGISQIESPVSLEKWLEIAKTLHNPAGDLYGAHFKGATTEALVEWLPFYTAAGGFLPTGEEDKTLPESETHQSLRQLKEFLPYCRPDVSESDNATLFEMLTTGKVGIVNHWSGQLGPIMNPEVNPFTEDYGFASLEHPWGTVWAFGISSASQHKLEAFSCLLHLTGASADLQQGKFSGSPARRSSFENKKAAKDYPWFPALLQAIERKNTFPATQSFADKMGYFYSMVHEFISGNQSAENAVQELNQKLELE